MNDAIIRFRCPAELKEKAEQAAKKEGRSLSNWIKWLVERETKK